MFELTSLKIPMSLLPCLSSFRGWSRCSPFVSCAPVRLPSCCNLCVRTSCSPLSIFLLTASLLPQSCISPVSPHSKAPGLALPSLSHWALTLFWCVEGFGGQWAVCVLYLCAFRALSHVFLVEKFSPALPVAVILPQVSVSSCHLSFRHAPPISPITCSLFF